MKKFTSVFLILALLLCLPAAAAAEGNDYWNEEVQLGCTLGDNWYFFTDEELAAQNGLTAEQMGEDYTKLVEESGSLMVMMAVDTQTGASVNLTLQPLSALESKVVGEAYYAKMSAPSLKEALLQMGFENVEATVGELEFMGSTHPCIRIAAVIQEMDFFETLAIYKAGDTVCIVTAASYGEDTTQAALANFYGEKP